MKLIRKYRIQYKLNSLYLVKILGISKTCKTLGIDRKTLNEWYIKQDRFKDIKEKNRKFRLPGGGAKPQTLEYEKQIVDLINERKKKNLSLKPKSIFQELYKIYPHMKKKTIKSLRCWWYRFIKRNNIKLK